MWSFFRGSREQVLLTGVVLAIASHARAEVSFAWADIGFLGNAADSTGFGAVAYQYRIARYEVTNAQYAEFLNAKGASSDGSSSLYSTNSGIGAGITRSGSLGSYTYSVVAGRDTHAVGGVSFLSAMRFVNWLSNGQGAGDTERGTYDIASSGGLATRALGAGYVLPSEDEWYKAAFYQPQAYEGPPSNYWTYATSTNSINRTMANYNDWLGPVTVDTVSVGSYQANFFGTYDMAGNVYEWNDALKGNQRGLRGGRLNFPDAYNLLSSQSYSEVPDYQNRFSGFRVAYVPGPGIGLSGVLLHGLLPRRRRG